MAKSGDVITYTVTLTVTNGTANNVQVQDVLPPHMSYVSMDPAPAGGTQTQAGSTLTWNWGTLGPGTYTLSYQGVLDTFIQQGSEIDNHAALTYTGLPAAKVATAKVVLATSTR